MKHLMLKAILFISVSASITTLHGETPASASRYTELLNDRREKQKLQNLAALEEAGIIDTQIISIYSNDPHPLIRLRCAEVMSRVQSPRGLPYLKALLRDGDEEVVKSALFALGLIGDPSSFESIKEVFLDSTGDVREEAVLALGRIASKEATSFLVNLLSNFDSHVRATSAYALAESGDKNAAANCLSLLNDPSSEVVEAAIYTLGRVGVKGSEKQIAGFLTSGERMIRLRAVEAMGRLECDEAVQAVSMLLGDPDRMVRVKAAEALRRIGGGAAAKAVRSILASEDHYLQTLALKTIAESREKSLYKESLPLLSSPSPMVRRAALTAAAATGGKKARGVLIETIEKGTDLERMTALELLGEISDKKDLALVIGKLLNSKNRFEREGAASALGEWRKVQHLQMAVSVDGVSGKITALEALTLCAADPDWVVAALSVESLGKLLGRDKGAHEAIPEVVKRFQSIFETRKTRHDGDLRVSIVEALEKIVPHIGKESDTGKVVLGVLKLACSDPDPRVREKASALTKKMGIPCTTVPKSLWKRGNKPWDTPPLPMGDRLITINTREGRIKIKLYGDDAPAVVYSILKLAREGFYNGLTFHRVVPGFVVQGGDPRGDGWGDAGYFLRSQFNRHRYSRGTVGMAHAGKDTAGSQFFITQLPQPHLDGRYTVVGEVIEGMDIVDTIEEQDTFTVEVIE